NVSMMSERLTPPSQNSRNSMNSNRCSTPQRRVPPPFSIKTLPIYKLFACIRTHDRGVNVAHQLSKRTQPVRIEDLNPLPRAEQGRASSELLGSQETEVLRRTPVRLKNVQYLEPFGAGLFRRIAQDELLARPHVDSER